MTEVEIVRLQADRIADAVAFTVGQDREVAINEILSRPVGRVG